ncbi:NAD(P)/FAD-dependent oxidoreductase [Streptomyces sp. NBC_00893]|uniref:NAD(P)/FAD-dependent oxidoreductase n=1 Tax=Streptomyces sp. NBC_00893 TaxID=2975862 RepID=UPI00225951FC|nr:FAD-dependent monooxygenase [Streptomyces sp. NBC_00893]MCX4849547.1 FAD-dependent monooxygenase [Streptomyces sp. NBC_00893]
MPTFSGRHGLVLGGGLAGLLAARVLAARTGRVTVVERDVYPEGPRARKGVPQARHTHLFLGTGVRAMESLIPGTLAKLLAAGARRVEMPAEVGVFAKDGWIRRARHDEFILCCSRDLIDWAVRDQVLRDERITVRRGAEVVALTGDAVRVTGAVVQDRGTGERERVDADHVVVATGRSTRIGELLEHLGLPPVPEEVVDVGTAYATRVFRADQTTDPLVPVISVAGDPTGSAMGGVVLPLEGERWSLTLMGMRGSEPPVEEGELMAYAKALAHPALHDLMSQLTPLGPIRGFRGMVNRRPRLDRLPKWPEGLVVVGDAACTLNPAHAHGMTVASMGIVALRDCLARPGDGPGSRRVQRAVSRAADGAWTQSVNDDLRHPAVVGPPLPLAARLGNAYADRVLRAAAVDPHVARAFVDIFTLAKGPASLLTPRILFAAFAPGRRGAPGA